MEYDLIFSQYKDAVDKSSIFSKTDINGFITYVNDRFCEITGYSEDELIGKTHSIIRDFDTPESIFSNIWKTITKGDVWSGILKNRKKDGTAYYVNSVIYPIKDKDGKILEYISIRQDITKLINGEKLLEIYSTDTVTHLPNRQKLNEVLASNQDEFMAILLDIQDFTYLNELYGDSVGDEILLKVAIKLNEYVSNDSVTLFKLCSNRYMILVRDKSLFSKYETLIKFSILMDEFIINDIIINFNIGISYGNNNLLNKASLALKEAKQRKDRFFIYSELLNTKDLHLKNMRKFQDFKDALLNDRIEPFFQPIVDAQSGKVIKYESLARMIDRDGNVVLIADFLDIAEKSSFFENFTRQMIQKVFAVSLASNQEVTINLTFENINSTELVKYIEHRLQKHNGPRITFEILESEEIEDYDVLNDFIDMVKSYGSLIAIDDFGTGYSNFVHLSKFKADFIKIDGSIISNLENDKNNKFILSLLIRYARKNNIKIIAEYVSSEEIAIIARDLGVDLFQGYLYGKAETAEFYNLINL